MQNMQEFDVQLTVQNAIDKYPSVKLRLISDNGSQLISKDLAEYLRIAGLQHIRISIAYLHINGKIERFHRFIHEECLIKTSFINLNDARKQIASYINYYNTKRLHSSLFY
jgi:transposase InsO family protein